MTQALQNTRSNITYRLAKRVSFLGNTQHHSVRTLSKKSKVSTTTIYRILNSAITPYNPSLRTLTKLAGGFGISLSSLMEIGVSARIAHGITKM